MHLNHVQTAGVQLFWYQESIEYRRQRSMEFGHISHFVPKLSVEGWRQAAAFIGTPLFQLRDPRSSFVDGNPSRRSTANESLYQ